MPDRVRPTGYGPTGALPMDQAQLMDQALRRSYLEDLPIGTRMRCGSFTLSLDDIVAFARRFDPQPFHLDEDAARASYFGGIAASGLHTQAAAIGLMVRAIADVAVVAGWSLHEARFLVPVRPGLAYDVEAGWTAIRPSTRNPARGTASIAIDVTHAEAAVARLGVTYVVARRPAGEPRVL